jgi:hypothetical protein
VNHTFRNFNLSPGGEDVLKEIAVDIREVIIGQYADWAAPSSTAGEIAGAVYIDGVLQPGCMICGATIPAKAAKARAKVCSDECRYHLRKIRQKLDLLASGEAALNCQVCRGLIPSATAKKLGVVCGIACRNELRRYRFQILQNQKCPHCYHPSTPEEREEFRQWRASRGPMQEGFRTLPGKGSPIAKREKALREVLRSAVAILQAVREVLGLAATDAMEGQPIRSSRVPGAEAIDAPIEAIIAKAEELLTPKEKLLP